jgi:hypothetical protein|tara:strand:- start:205 stop:633 length:429 start_codon:yes stop_codon:yes gene_type:complete
MAMIQITFTPETPAQAAVVAEAIGKYLGTVAVGETVAEVKEPVAEAPKLSRAKKSPTDANTAKPEKDSSIPETSAPTAPTKSSTDEPASQVTLEEVRLVLANLSQGGKAAEVKSLIAQFKAAKLTEIPADKYAEVLAAAKEL